MIFYFDGSYKINSFLCHFDTCGQRKVEKTEKLIIQSTTFFCNFSIFKETFLFPIWNYDLYTFFYIYNIFG